jgi:immunity protein 8 of polymorphic toxin system
MLHIEPLALDLGSPPEDPLHFSRDVEIVIRANEDFRYYAGLFWIEVCTPSWLAENARSAGWTWGRRRLVIPRWDAQTIERAITSVVALAPTISWTALVQELQLYWHSEELPDNSDAPAS